MADNSQILPDGVSANEAAANLRKDTGVPDNTNWKQAEKSYEAQGQTLAENVSTFQVDGNQGKALTGTERLNGIGHGLNQDYSNLQQISVQNIGAIRTAGNALGYSKAQQDDDILRATSAATADASDDHVTNGYDFNTASKKYDQVIANGIGKNATPEQNKQAYQSLLQNYYDDSRNEKSNVKFDKMSLGNSSDANAALNRVDARNLGIWPEGNSAIDSAIASNSKNLSSAPASNGSNSATSASVSGKSGTTSNIGRNSDVVSSDNKKPVEKSRATLKRHKDAPMKKEIHKKAEKVAKKATHQKSTTAKKSPKAKVAASQSAITKAASSIKYESYATNRTGLSKSDVALNQKINQQTGVITKNTQQYAAKHGATKKLVTDVKDLNKMNKELQLNGSGRSTQSTKAKTAQNLKAIQNKATQIQNQQQKGATKGKEQTAER